MAHKLNKVESKTVPLPERCPPTPVPLVRWLPSLLQILEQIRAALATSDHRVSISFSRLYSCGW